MGGIYIPGMEMPTTGLYLVSVDNSCGKDETVMTVKRMLGNRDVCQIIGVYNLVPVPEHGDLIDRNALPWEKQGKMLTDPDEWGLKATDIENAPAVIPADHIGGVNEMVADKEGEG